jgi:hypothetical protein
MFTPPPHDAHACFTAPWLSALWCSTQQLSTHQSKAQMTDLATTGDEGSVVNQKADGSVPAQRQVSEDLVVLSYSTLDLNSNARGRTNWPLNDPALTV